MKPYNFLSILQFIYIEVDCSTNFPMVREMGPFYSYTSSWYNDNALFVIFSSPWFIRGSSYNFGPKWSEV